MKKGWDKQTWLCITLILIGLFCVVISSTGVFKFNPKNVVLIALTDTGLKSLGFSFISTALVTFLKSKSEDTNIEEINKLLIEIKNNQFSVNQRIKIGKHLKDEFPCMLKESVTELDGIIRIDIKGMELYNFWEDQKEIILNQMKRFHIRLLVQDPFSDSFEKMAINEGVNQQKITNNIVHMTKAINELTKNGTLNDTDRKVEVRWLSFPASVTMTKVNNQMYVRTRLMNSNNMNDLHFFEKYYQGDMPFDTFSTLFEMEWRNYEEEPCLAKKHLEEYCIDTD